MIKYRFFVIVIIILLLIYLLFNVYIWHTTTKYIFSSDLSIGGLSRVSYKLDSSIPRKNINNLTKKHINIKDYSGERIDILTIGDSFSNADAGGPNPYYQDYISTINNCNVLNILQLPLTNNYIETIALLNNKNILKKLGIKHVIIESVERESIVRFGNNINFNVSSDKDVLKSLKSIGNPYEFEKDKDINFINNLNFNAFFYKILYNFNDRAFFSNCYVKGLNQDLFTSKDQNSLLFWKDDIRNIKLSTFQSVKKLNDNFNKLSKKLKGKGIKLYFMPAVDKYNLYSKYIVNNPYPESTFFEYLRKLPKEYELIDTKKILKEELEKGIKDLYYPDDTHWSYKASEAIFKKVEFE